METIIKSKKSLATLNNAQAFDGATKLASFAQVRRINLLIKNKKRSKKR